MTRLPLLIAALLAVLTAPVQGTRQDPAPNPVEDPAEALRAADLAFCRETGELGLEGWLRWFAPDAVVLDARGEPVEGPEALRGHYGALGIPPPGFTWSPDGSGLSEGGDLGFTEGSWEVRIEGRAAASGRYLSVWGRQEDGSHRVVTDLGGRPDYRTRVEGLEGPPSVWTTRALRSRVATSGDLAFVLGTWTARAGDEERTGTFLSVWRRTGEGAWELASEIGS